MQLIPSRQARPSDDPIFGLHQEATARRARGEAVLDATIGVLLDDSGALAVLPTAAKAVHEVSTLDFAPYAPISGNPEYLRAVIADLLAPQPDLATSAVAVATPGGSGAVRHAIANFLERGQALLTTSWYWSPYGTLADESDRRLETFEMFAPDGSLDIAAFDAALDRQLRTQGRSLVILNDPAHNPTGYSMSDSDWRGIVERILDRAGQGPVALLVDCAYLVYGASEDPRAFLRHLVPLVGKATVLFAWSASKSFTLYGQRVGALVACVGDPKERDLVKSALSYSCRGTWSNCNRGGMTAVTKLLAHPESARAAAAERAELARTLAARVRAFNRRARERSVKVPRYEGGFFVMAFLPRALETAAAMRSLGVYVVPQTREDGQGALRLALCAVPESQVERLVDAVADCAR
jgi:aromatic-amino-acid transaminase